MAYANVQTSGLLRTNTGAGLSWSPGSAPTLNNLLTQRVWGWDASPGYTPGTTDARDSSGTPKTYTRDSSINAATSFGAGIYSLVVPAGLTTPLRNVSTSDALEGCFDEWSGGATSSVLNTQNTSSGNTGTPVTGASITTGANAGLVLSSMVTGNVNGTNNGLTTAGTSFSNDAIERDNSSWQSGAADKRTASVASATLNNSWTLTGGTGDYATCIASYNLSGGGGGTTVTPNAIGSGESVPQPTVRLQVLPNAVGTAEAVYQPTVTIRQTVTPNAIATGEAVYQPTVSIPSPQTVSPNAIGTAEQVYQPVVNLAGGTQTVLPMGIASGQQVYAPQVNSQLLPDAISSGEQDYAPTVFRAIPQTVTPDVIPSAELVFNPQVALIAPAVQPDTIPSAERVYAPVVALLPRWPPPHLLPTLVPDAPDLVADVNANAPALVGAAVPPAPSLRKVDVCQP